MIKIQIKTNNARLFQSESWFNCVNLGIGFGLAYSVYQVLVRVLLTQSGLIDSISVFD